MSIAINSMESSSADREEPPVEKPRFFQPRKLAARVKGRRSGMSGTIGSEVPVEEFRPRWWPGASLEQE